MDLRKLADPFPAEDIEWRVARAGRSGGKLWCMVLAYITARAIQQRLDEVCGPGNWRNEPMTVHEIKPGVFALQVGISIRLHDGWVTKWDVSEPTHVEPAKGGFSGAMKRAGAQWGIGRYLYHLDETFAEVSEDRQAGWHFAKLADRDGGGNYYWKPPQLPAWALPKEEEPEVSPAELNRLKAAWKAKLAPDVRKRDELAEGFSRFVTSIVGGFPVHDHAAWTQDALLRCTARVEATKEPGGVSPDVPFDK